MIEAANTQTLYRALFTKEHMRLWNSGRRNCSHHQAPGEWFKIRKDHQSIQPNDYPLEVESGVYTIEALRAFIDLSSKGDDAIWSHEENRRVGELAGTCAFTTPEAAWEYGHNTHAGQIMLESYVEFEDNILCKAPEDRGVVATVIRITAGPMTATEFNTKHNL